MFHKIKSVKALKNYNLLVVFQNGIEKTYDMHQLYAAFPQFQILEKEIGLFEQVTVDTGGYGISWNSDLDLSAEEIWEMGTSTGKIYEVEVNFHLAENLLQARTNAGLTQLQLSELTGIYQGDISKIERGLANPSVNTLKRLAEGMGMKLHIEFVNL